MQAITQVYVVYTCMCAAHCFTMFFVLLVITLLLGVQRQRCSDPIEECNKSCSIESFSCPLQPDVTGESWNRWGVAVVKEPSGTPNKPCPGVDDTQPKPKLRVLCKVANTASTRSLTFNSKGDIGCPMPQCKLDSSSTSRTVGCCFCLLVILPRWNFKRRHRKEKRKGNASKQGNGRKKYTLKKKKKTYIYI